jgi:hypothetical protein
VTLRGYGATADFFFHQTTSKEFAQRAKSCKERVLSLLSQYQVWRPTLPGWPSSAAVHPSHVAVHPTARGCTGRQGFEGDGGSAPEDEYEVMDALTLALDVQLDNVDAFLRQHKENGGASTSGGMASTTETAHRPRPRTAGAEVCTTTRGLGSSIRCETHRSSAACRERNGGR